MKEKIYRIYISITLILSLFLLWNYLGLIFNEIISNNQFNAGLTILAVASLVITFQNIYFFTKANEIKQYERGISLVVLVISQPLLSATEMQQLTLLIILVLSTLLISKFANHGSTNKSNITELCFIILFSVVFNILYPVIYVGGEVKDLLNNLSFSLLWSLSFIKIICVYYYASKEEEYLGNRLDNMAIALLCLAIIFSSTYRFLILKPNILYQKSWCLPVLGVISLIASLWFGYLYTKNWDNKAGIDPIFTKRVQLVNSISFLFASMSFFIVNYTIDNLRSLLFTMSAAVMAFSIYHSRSLTLWPKINIDFNEAQSDLQLKRFRKKEYDQITKFLKSNFFYFYQFYFGLTNDTDVSVLLRLHLLIISSSPFSYFGNSFYKIFNRKQEVVGIAAITCQSSECIFYTATSYLKFFISHSIIFGIGSTVSLLKKINEVKAEFLTSIPSNVLEVDYIVILDEHKHQGYGRKFFNGLEMACANIRAKSHLDTFESIRMTVRSKNFEARKAFENFGFTKIAEDNNSEFATFSKQGNGIFYELPL